jgi:hypothetical protein
MPRIAGGARDIGAYEQQRANFVVDTAVDENDGDFAPGDLSLREAFQLAAADPVHDVIEFSTSLADSTITLTLGELLINSDLTLLGLGADRLAISGSKSSRVFRSSDKTYVF